MNLRRVIKQNDRVIGDTTRVLKQEKDYSRPDKGERIKVRIALTVEKISLDDVLDRFEGRWKQFQNQAMRQFHMVHIIHLFSS